MDKFRQTIKTYDEISNAYADTASGPSERIDLFLRLIKKGRNILDVGCGPGIDVAYMVRKGFLVTGVDLSEKMIKLASEKNPNVHFEKVDMRKLKFEPGAFDGIIASFSVIHLPKKDVSNVTRNFYRMLKNGGIIYFGVQEGESREVIDETPLEPNRKMFLNIISKKELTEILNKAGFEILDEFIRSPKNKELNFNKLIVIARKGCNKQ